MTRSWEFKSGQITTVNGELFLDGANTRVADAGATSTNSALTGLTSVAGEFFLENGVKVTTTGNLSVTGSASVQVDGPSLGGGGSHLTIGGNLANSSTNGNGVAVGWTGLTSADSLTVNGKAGISNTGEINIEGTTTTQAILNVANAAAGFGTVGVETGTVFLENDALLEFKSGSIKTINGELFLNGANARVADAGATSTNSALTGLTSVAGEFFIENGVKVTTTGNLSVTGSASVQVDGPSLGGGGSHLTIGGNLTNSSTNGNGVAVGWTGLNSADSLTVNGKAGISNTGEINIEGSTTAQATLNVANAAAGFGTVGVETGTVVLENDALLEFKSGEIKTINGELFLNGANARVADAGATSSNSALTGLTSVAGNFFIENGVKVSTTGNLNVTGNASVQVDGPSLRRRRQPPDDRRQPDQQQHQWQWRRGRLDRAQFGRQFDSEWKGRDLQHRRDQY